MSDYHQPSFYHFNQDSLDLVRWIQKHCQIPPQNILDLGAGSGIIGLELAQIYRPQELALVELQLEYLPYLKKNLEFFLPPETKAQIEIRKFSEFKSSSLWQMIVCNPPYYLPGHGQSSQDEKKSKARSFQVDNWSELLKCIERHLEKAGSAYLVIKNDKMIKQEILTASKSTSLKIHIHDEGNLNFIVLTWTE